MGVDVKLVTVGKKGAKYFKRRTDQYSIIGMSDSPCFPTSQLVAHG